MTKQKFDDDDGVWRTIGGRKVFIREGQSVSDAMKQSGKFKGLTKKSMEMVSGKFESKEEKEMFEKAGNEAKEIVKGLKEQNKNLNDLEQERDAKFKEIVGANTKRQDIYEHAGSDEAYKNLYGKEPEKNAKNQLSDSDYKKYEELTNQYHGGRKDLAKIDKQIEEYRKTHPKEETKKASGKFWEEAEKERQQIKAEATKAGKSVEEYEKQKTNEMFGKGKTNDYENDELARLSGGAITTLKTSVPQSKQERIKVGTEIYYKGDMANTPGYFTVESFEPEKERYMTSITLKEKGGEGRTKKIGAQQIEDNYTNNYASRFSFKEDYDNFRNSIYEQYAKKYGSKTSDTKSDSSTNQKNNNEAKQLASNSGQEKINNNVKVMRYGDDYIVLKNGHNEKEFKTQGDAEKYAKTLVNTKDDYKEKTASTKYTGYQQYLRDRYGTENEDIVSAGNKSKSKLYQEYKDETIRRVNRERLTPGVTNIETAYKRAFEKYKKEHPNTKLNFQEFKKMAEE